MPPLHTLPAHITHRLEHLATVLVLTAATALDHAHNRLCRLRLDDRGSVATEKALLIAIGIILTIGTAWTIATAVAKYQAQIH